MIFLCCRLDDISFSLRVVESFKLKNSPIIIELTDEKMAFIVLLKILLLFLFLPKTANLIEFHSIGEEQTLFIIDICKLHELKSVIFLYAESTEGKSIFYFLLFISIIFIFILLRNGNGNYDIQI